MGSKLCTLAAMLFAMSLSTGCDRDEGTDWTPITFDDDAADPKQGKQRGKKKAPDADEPTPAAKPSPAAKPTSQSAARDGLAIEQSDRTHLRERSRRVHQLLLSALPASDRKLVEDIPLVVDDQRGSVNAFAACLKDGRALVAVSDGLMQVQAQLARAQATDEIFSTNKLEAYLAQLSRSSNLMPPSGFIDAQQDADPRKRARQAQLLDEGLAFVIGHELAHHRLSHTGCVGRDRGQVTSADVARMLSQKVPLFNQPNELASDVYGVQNLLRAGADGTGWTEGGGLLMLRFFRARTQQSLQDALVFGFERTHPHPDVRIPVVEQTARAFRLSGGRSLPNLPQLGL